MVIHANDDNLQTLNERPQPIGTEPDTSALAWGAGYSSTWDGSQFQVLKWYLDDNGNRMPYAVDADGTVYNPDTEAPPGVPVTIYYRTDYDQEATAVLVAAWYEKNPFVPPTSTTADEIA